MHTAESLLGELNKKRGQDYVFIYKKTCKPCIHNILESMSVYVICADVCLLSQEEAVRLSNILETML